jgi:predicted dehydrogenase
MYPALAQKFGAAYVEKPFARTLAEHDQNSSFFLPERVACGYQRRSLGAARAMREIIRSKLFGTLEHVDMGFGGPLIKTGGRYSTSLEMAGGGVLFEVGVHGLDFVLHVCDASATRPVAVDMIKREGFDLHTKATLDVERTGGPTVRFDLVVTNLERSSNVHVFTFENASITFALFGDNVIRVRPRNGSPAFVLAGELTDYPRASDQIFHEHWRCFFEAIRTGHPNATSAIDSRVTTQAVEQLYAAEARA